MNQTMVLSSSAVELVAMQFAREFQDKFRLIRQCCDGVPVSKNFFAPSEGKSGFLSDLIACLDDQGFTVFSRKVKAELNDNRTLPVMEFAKAIADLSRHQLDKLALFHTKMESNQGKDEANFPLEYKKIASYFDRANGPNENSAEAGRLVMLLSTISRHVIEMKELFERYMPKTVAVYDTVLCTATSNPLSKRIVDSLDDAHRAVDYLLKNVTLPDFPLFELNKTVSALKTQKNRFIRFVIVNCQKLKSFSTSVLIAAKRNIKAWCDWERISLSGEKSAEAEAFEQQLLKFKKEISSDFDAYDSLSQNVQSCLRERQPVSSYFLYMLRDLLVLVEEIVKSGVKMVDELRIKMQKLTCRIKNTTDLHESILVAEKKILEQFPESLQNRLDHLNHELVHVLARGNPKEIKYISLAFQTSYKNIGVSVPKALAESGITKDVEKFCDIYKKRFASIVQSSCKIFNNMGTRITAVA